ncbi:MAG: SIS domain-containing protein [Solirubrobacterales bacterium]|nr:SIS domain-containing protein [Solirubrobacterales bacterium]
MSRAGLADGTEARLRAQLAARTEGNRRFFGPRTDGLARLCHRMAERFARGGRLIALASTPAARSDARHVAVEFVHPVIVGKRALPAIALIGDAAELAAEAGLLARPDDMAIAFGAEEDGGAAARALRIARERGCLTLAFSAAGAEWELEPPVSDRHVRQELIETLYHVLWELVHVFFEHRGLLEGRDRRATHDAGASSFLYPFLAEREDDLERVIGDVASSAQLKSEEIGGLRELTLTDNAAALSAAADTLRESLATGGTLLALGNGGSATDAADVVADFRHPAPGTRAWPAIDLTEDPAILTAIANDIGTEAIFARQVIAYGRPGDVLLALSTSGNSANVIAALAQARRQNLKTIAMVGYDGGRIDAEALADQVIVSRSEHIPRIQEAQASAYHVLRVLTEEPAE